MSKSKYEAGMVTVKIPKDVHHMLKLIKMRYKKDIGDSLRDFVMQFDPSLADAAQQLTELQEKQEQIILSVTGEDNEQAG